MHVSRVEGAEADAARALDHASFLGIHSSPRDCSIKFSETSLPVYVYI